MSKTKLGALGGNFAGGVIVAGVMTGTNVIGPVVLDIDEADILTFDISYTGTPTGTFKFEVSNSVLPNRTNLSGTPVRAGSWKDLTSRLVPALTNPAGAAGNQFVGFPLGDVAMGATYLRVSYTNASGVGVLDVYMTGKALG